MLQCLPAKAWDATKHLDLAVVESSGGFQAILSALDKLYQYDDTVEAPARCAEYFEKFARRNDETLNEYEVREREVRTRLKDVGVIVPEIVAGWIVLSRAGIPHWQEPNVRAICRGKLTPEGVHDALKQLFGGDHKPERRDARRAVQRAGAKGGDAYAAEDWNDEDWYGDEWYDDEEAYYEDDEDYLEEDEIPEELDEAFEACEEAMATWQEARSKMNELARARGFYPVVALTPHGHVPVGARVSSSKGKGKKGGGKNGKGKKGGGKSSGKRGTYGRGGGGKGASPPSSSAPAASATAPPSTPMFPKSTTSGSTQQHGPRFKRMRNGAFANNDDGFMVQDWFQDQRFTDIATVPLEEVNNVEAGDGIADCGATRPVIGEEVWHQWVEILRASGLDQMVEYNKVDRTFKYGNGQVLPSSYEVRVPVKVFGQDRFITISVVPGNAPLLIARTALEEWGLIIDFRNHRAMLADNVEMGWIPMRQSGRGHLMLELVPRVTKENLAETFAADDKEPWDIESGSDSASTEDESDGDDDGSQAESQTEVDAYLTEFEPLAASYSVGRQEFDEKDSCQSGANRRQRQMLMTAVGQHLDEILVTKDTVTKDVVRQRIVWQLFDDDARVAEVVSRTYEDVYIRVVNVSHGYDVEKAGDRSKILKEIDEQQPDEIYMSPSCPSWDSEARLQVGKDREGRSQLHLQRRVEERTLKLCRDIYDKQLEAQRGAHLAMRGESDAWAYNGFVGMQGFETNADLCRYGMKLRDRQGRFLGYSNGSVRIRSTRQDFAAKLGRTCTCHQPHVEPGGSVQRYSQPWEFAKAVADLLVVDDGGDADILAVDSCDADKVPDLLKGLRKKHSDVIIRQVKRLHEQLGHPSNAKLVNALRDSGATNAVMACAREFACESCLKRQHPKSARIVALATARSFNDIVDMDTYHIKVGRKKFKVLAMLDEYTRYEVDQVINRESSGNVVKAVVRGWISTFGAMRMLRTDMAGAHTSTRMKDCCTAYNIKLQLIPEGAHYRLGALERNHAVRREQIAIFMDKNRDVEPKKSVVITCAARNRLHNARGWSPVQRVFGAQPRLPGQLDEEYFFLGEQDLRRDDSNYMKDMEMRADACEAYHQAAISDKLRSAMLARSRPVRREYSLGEWCYYWRAAKDSKLVKAHWHGPGLVVCNEVSGTDASRTSTIWVVHGPSLFRCTPEQLRPEFPAEARRREEKEPTAATAVPTFERLRAGLQGVRGPVNFHDLAHEGEKPDVEIGSDNEMEQDVPDVPAGPAVPMDQNHAPAAAEHAAENGPTAPAQASAAVAATAASPARSAREGSAPDPFATPTRRPVVEQPRSAVRLRELESVIESEDMARRLDGLPPLKRTRPEYSTLVPPAGTPAVDVPVLDDSFDMVLLAEFDDEIYLVKANSGELIWSRLNKDEQELFQVAKSDAVQIFVDNGAWQPIHKSKCEPAQSAPLRFLLKWKAADGGTRTASARVIWQGFKHEDATSKVLDKESPTLSRLGRNFILMIAAIKEWALFVADVKSAFLQADEVEAHVKNYGIPTREMQRFLGIDEDTYVHMVKPMFGDPMAPRRWNDTFFKELRAVQLRQHRMDKCVWFALTDADNQLDGILGIHVDDMLGAAAPGGKTAAACEELSRRFKFGSWKTGNQLTFTGCDVITVDGEVHLQMPLYMNKVLPITIDKERRSDPNAACTPKEHTRLRALMGALQWPAGQCMPHGAATVSILAAEFGKPRVQCLSDGNKALRFFKENANIPLRFPKIVAELGGVRFGIYEDAAWANRADYSSQGGYLLFAMDEAGMKSGEARPLVVIDWCSRKLPRMCRSSLSAEAQSGCIAVDALEWAKLFFAALLYPDRPIDDPTLYKEMGESVVVTDARALYDASRSASAGLGLQEKRTAIELSILNERMEAIGAVWKWVDNTKQLADGLTKLQSRQVLADILRCGAHALKFDGVVKAGKKQTQAEKQQHQREVEGYANQKKRSRGAGASSAAAVGSAMLAVASGGRASRMTAAMAALSLADAAELAVYGSCPVNSTMDNTMMLQYVLCGIFMGLVIAGYGCWTCRKGEMVMKKQEDLKKTLRSVKTQSQTTYMRKWATPRFHVISEGEQGVSLDLT